MGREEEENTQADQMPALWALQNMGEDMTDKEFIKYCAEVMGYKIISHGDYGERFTYEDGVRYDPLTYLNEMAEVFDKLWKDREDLGFGGISLLKIIIEKGIAQAMREFIESTKGESE